MQYCNITRHTRHFCMLGVVPDCLRSIYLTSSGVSPDIDLKYFLLS